MFVPSPSWQNDPSVFNDGDGNRGRFFLKNAPRTRRQTACARRRTSSGASRGCRACQDLSRICRGLPPHSPAAPAAKHPSPPLSFSLLGLSRACLGKLIAFKCIRMAQKTEISAPSQGPLRSGSLRQSRSRPCGRAWRRCRKTTPFFESNLPVEDNDEDCQDRLGTPMRSV